MAKTTLVRITTDRPQRYDIGIDRVSISELPAERWGEAFGCALDMLARRRTEVLGGTREDQLRALRAAIDAELVFMEDETVYQNVTRPDLSAIAKLDFQ